MGVWFLSTASANKFAGTLSSYYPETMVTVTAVESQQAEKSVVLCTKLDKPEVINGVNYVSIDAISFEEVKNKEVKASIVKGIFQDSLTKEKIFLGYKIDSLYAFFMIFVVMAGVASIILYLLSKKLLKMMNGVQ